jgi:hypothetical protein
MFSAGVPARRASRGSSDGGHDYQNVEMSNLNADAEDAAIFDDLPQDEFGEAIGTSLAGSVSTMGSRSASGRGASRGGLASTMTSIPTSSMSSVVGKKGHLSMTSDGSSSPVILHSTSATGHRPSYPLSGTESHRSDHVIEIGGEHDSPSPNMKSDKIKMHRNVLNSKGLNSDSKFNHDNIANTGEEFDGTVFEFPPPGSEPNGAGGRRRPSYVITAILMLIALFYGLLRLGVGMGMVPE